MTQRDEAQGPVNADVARHVIEQEAREDNDARQTKPDHEPPPADSAAPIPAVIALDSRGRLAPKDHRQLKAACAGWVQSGWVPKSMLQGDNYQPLPFDKAVLRVLMAAQMLRALGMAPETSLRFVAIVKGTPSIFGDLPLSVVLRSGEMDGRLDEYMVNDIYERICVENKNLGDTVFAAVVRGKRRGQDPAVRSFSVADAKRANLMPGKPGSAWSSYPQRMLQMRARSHLLKDLFPDVLAGAAISEYDFGPELMPEHAGLPAVHAKRALARAAAREGAIDLDAAYPDRDGGGA